MTDTGDLPLLSWFTVLGLCYHHQLIRVYMWQLLTKDPLRRLGCGPGDAAEVKVCGDALASLLGVPKLLRFRNWE